MFWGLTPALDLLKEYKAVHKNLPAELNILIVGGADCRHVLTTIARKYRYTNVKINFYLVEGCLESIARQLLLLNITLQNQESLGLDQRAKIFMEIYGNTLVRPTVAKFLKSTSLELLKMVTDKDYLKSKMNSITLDLKYKEKDYLENLYKFWAGKDEFNICDCWDRRLRTILGRRYDSKFGAFDWDLHMRLHQIGGRQVCNQEYKNFRLNGVAFSWLESEVSKPNRTFVCAVIPNGDKFAHHGYLGDMQSGPFIAYGLDCEDSDFLKTTNTQNVYRATDVTERNLKQIFYEIHNKEAYMHKSPNDNKLGPVVMKQDKLIVDNKGVENIPKASKEYLTLEDTVTFLSLSSLATMKYKEKYKDLFHVIYLGSTYLKYFDKEMIRKTSDTDGLVIIEHQLFVLNHRKDDLIEFGKAIDEKTETFRKFEFDPEKDTYAKFICNKKESNE